MDEHQDYICENCGTVGKLKKVTPGSIWIELLLWICFLLPGLLYSAWRISTRGFVCQKCGSKKVMGADTPKGKMLAKQFAE